MAELQDQIASLLAGAPGDKTILPRALQLVLAEFKSETGTLHLLDRRTQTLHLIAEIGLPPALREVVKTIPVGKGIAGQVVARSGPVSICNLRSDASGTARPGAQQSGVGGALCVPLWRGADIVGTLGIGTRREHEYSTEETRRLTEVGRQIAGTVESFRD